MSVRVYFLRVPNFFAHHSLPPPSTVSEHISSNALLELVQPISLQNLSHLIHSIWVQKATKPSHIPQFPLEDARCMRSGIASELLQLLLLPLQHKWCFGIHSTLSPFKFFLSLKHLPLQLGPLTWRPSILANSNTSAKLEDPMDVGWNWDSKAVVSLDLRNEILLIGRFFN